MTLNDIYIWQPTSNKNIYSGIPAWGLVFAMLNLESEIKAGRITKIFLELGDASYALYLFHVFIIMFFTRILFAKIISDNKNIIISIILDVIIMTITIIGSIVIYRILDKPVQKYLRNIINRKS